MTPRRLALLVGAAALLTGGAIAVVQAQPAPDAAPEAPPQEPVPPSVEAPPAVVAPAPDAAPARPARPAGDEEEQAKIDESKMEQIEPGAPMPIPPRARGQIAVIQALDKVTAESIRFEVPVGQPVRYKNLIFTVRACETTGPLVAAPESLAYVEILNQPRPRPGYSPPTKQVFRGWMFASSPGLNPLEHPVYDAWLIACKAVGPLPVTAAPVRPARPAAARPAVKPAAAPAAPAATAPSAPAPAAPAPKPAPAPAPAAPSGEPPPF